MRLASVDALTLTAEKGDFVLAHRATTIVCRFDWRLILAYWEERVRRLNWVTVAGLRQQLARTFEVLDVAASRSPK